MTVSALIKKIVGAKEATAFSPDHYWENRHRQYYDSHEAVGHIGLSADENATQYATKRGLIVDAIRRHISITPDATLLDAGTECLGDVDGQTFVRLSRLLWDQPTECAGR